MAKRILYDAYRYGKLMNRGVSANGAHEITKISVNNINTYARRGFETKEGYSLRIHGEPYQLGKKDQGKDTVTKEFWKEWEQVTGQFRKKVKWVKCNGKKLRPL